MSPMPPQAVLFDMDGVLIDSFEIWVPVLIDTAVELECPPVTRPMIEKTWGQSVDDDVESFYPGHSVAEVTASFDRLLLRHVDRVVVSPGAPEILMALRESSVPHAVVTNCPRSLALALLDAAGLAVDPVVSGTEVPRPKPAPDMLLHACELLGVEATLSVMVGDTQYDGEAAAAAGMTFVGYQRDGDLRVDALMDILERLALE